MKTYQDSYFKISNTVKIMAIAIFFSTLFISCGDDSENFITAKTSSVTFDDLNTCDIGSGLPATSFDFIIDYDASDNIEITKILFELTWTSGESESVETTDFTDTGAQIEYDWCYRFGSDDWVEISHRLETKNDKKSNSSLVRVNKPDGAN